MLDEIKVSLDRAEGNIELPGELGSSDAAGRGQPVDDHDQPQELFIVVFLLHGV